jgi:hypothetical protein
LSDPDLLAFAKLSGMFKHIRHEVEAFLAWELSVKGDDLVAEGFKKDQIGIELERRETLLFSQVLDERRQVRIA